MKQKDIVKYSVEDLPEVTEEEIQRVKKIREEDIDYSDIPEITEDMWETAKVVNPRHKELVTIRLDPEILEYFRSLGRGYQTKINAVLLAYVRSKSKKPRSVGVE